MKPITGRNKKTMARTWACNSNHFYTYCMQPIMSKLIADQENQLRAFERHRAEMLQAVKATEEEILEQHGCTLSNAPWEVITIITKLRDDFNRYWSNDGILITELMRRQTAARQRVIDSMC